MNLSLRRGDGVFKIDGVLLTLDYWIGSPGHPANGNAPDGSNAPGGIINFATRPTAQQRMLVNNNENLRHDRPYADRTQAIIYTNVTY